MFPELGIGVLSWRAHETLRTSLDSYSKVSGFLDLFAEKNIYFSDISETDKEIAKEYGWGFSGGKNLGIAAGMRRLAEKMSTPYVILLQNDNPLVEELGFCHSHLQERISFNLINDSVRVIGKTNEAKRQSHVTLDHIVEDVDIFRPVSCPPFHTNNIKV